MEIFPAIDLQNGQCVRLAQGNFNAATIYSDDPILQAQEFNYAGANWLHVVDLDGARDGESRQMGLIAQIAAKVPLKVQVGGGIRQQQDIDYLLAAGATRAVIGSLAVKNPALVKEWLRHFGPERIVLACDVKMDAKGTPEVLTHGWQTGSHQSLWEFLEIYSDSGLQTILCTDVGRDGMLTGGNATLYQAIQHRYPTLDILASGGISGVDDLLVLAKLRLAGAIVGKAIYEGRINVADAVEKLKHAG